MVEYQLTWTGSNQTVCGTCHDVENNPERLSGMHKKHVEDEAFPCRTCHATTVNVVMNIIGKQLHVDGQKTVVFAIQEFYSNGN